MVLQLILHVILPENSYLKKSGGGGGGGAAAPSYPPSTLYAYVGTLSLASHARNKSIILSISSLNQPTTEFNAINAVNAIS